MTHMGATEDAASRRPARPVGTRLRCETSSVGGGPAAGPFELPLRLLRSDAAERREELLQRGSASDQRVRLAVRRVAVGVAPTTDGVTLTAAIADELLVHGRVEPVTLLVGRARVEARSPRE